MVAVAFLPAGAVRADRCFRRSFSLWSSDRARRAATCTGLWLFHAVWPIASALYSGFAPVLRLLLGLVLSELFVLWLAPSATASTVVFDWNGVACSLSSGLAIGFVSQLAGAPMLGGAVRDWFSIRSADQCAADTAGLVRITIKLLDGRAFSISADPVLPIGELKRRLAAVCGIQPEHQRLVFGGRSLCDDLSLS